MYDELLLFSTETELAELLTDFDWMPEDGQLIEGRDYITVAIETE